MLHLSDTFIHEHWSVSKFMGYRVTLVCEWSWIGLLHESALFWRLSEVFWGVTPCHWAGDFWCSFEMVRTTCPGKHCHIPEEHCEKLRSCIILLELQMSKRLFADIVIICWYCYYLLLRNNLPITLSLSDVLPYFHTVATVFFYAWGEWKICGHTCSGWIYTAVWGKNVIWTWVVWSMLTKPPAFWILKEKTLWFIVKTWGMFSE